MIYSSIYLSSLLNLNFFPLFSLVKNAVVNNLGYFLIKSLAYISSRKLQGPGHILMALDLDG